MFGENADFEIVFNAIELNQFAFDKQIREKMRRDMGITNGQLVVGHLGRFIPQKNHLFLLRVFLKLLERRPDALLVLAGDGECRPKVEHWAKEHRIADRVVFLGQREDAHWLYQAFDVFALPSLYEGLGIVAIEAQRAGLPCVLSNRVPYEVNVTGTTSFLPLDDEGAWVDAILKVCRQKRYEVRVEDFLDYDITHASGVLQRRYLQLAGCVSSARA